MGRGSLARRLGQAILETTDQRAPRSIMRTEALVKFVFGDVATASPAQIDIAAGQYQVGAGRFGGAVAEAADMRAVVNCRPEATLLSLDVKNAFGCVQWHQALQILLAPASRLAAPLACQ